LHVLAAALRSFLRFLHFTGRTRAPLWNAVVCPVPRPPRPIPDTLSEPELHRFLKAFDRTQATGKRDFAMALCLCRLGLRAREVASLTLEDVDWQGQTLHLQHTKTRSSRLVPLPQDVAAAIRDYLRAGRPPTDSPVVFVRHRTPWGAGRRSSIVRAAMRCACIRAGLSHKGVHILRHPLATRLHQRGVPLKTIADWRGHLSLHTTARYARVHLSELRQAALPWPR
jgi:site-specific recombinase XerD